MTSTDDKSRSHTILDVNNENNSIEQQHHPLGHNPHKTKDIDQQSIASSTHFTLINGCGRANLKSQSSLCRHGRQITVLVVTMTMFFIIGILFILYLMDRKFFKFLN
jgi:hypothetical protein